MTKEIEYNGKKIPVRYRHMRKHNFDCDGRYIVSPKGGKTIAIAILDRFNSVAVFAECSKKDTFSKKIGREISYARLKSLLARLTPAE